MKRKAALSFEPMERRTLLSLAPTDLVGTVTTNQSTYALGQPIQFLLTETNTSDQPVALDYGPSTDFFEVEQNGVPLWNTNSGIAIPMWMMAVTLQPGQSYTQGNTWNGIFANETVPSAPGNGSATTTLQTATGTLTVLSGSDPSAAPATFQIQSPVSYQLSVTTPPASSSIVSLNDTITNVTSSPVAVTVPPAEFQISNGNGIIEDTNPDASTQPSQTETVQPGQSIVQTATWNDAAYVSTIGGQLDLSNLTVTVPTAPSGMVAPFNLNGLTDPYAPPLIGTPGGLSGGESSGNSDSITSVITTTPVGSSTPSNTPVYVAGQPVRISVSLTNSSTTTVKLTKPLEGSKITILDGDIVVFRKTKLAHPTKAKLLQAGRSLDLAFVWNGKPNQPGVKKLDAGAYTIDVDDDGYLAETSIKIVGRDTKSSA